MTGIFLSVPNTTDALSCHIHLPICLRVMDPRSRASEKNTSYGNEVLPHDNTHLLQRSCYQRRSPCQDPAGNRTTRRSPDHRKEMQTAVVGTCLPFIRSGQNRLARHSGRGGNKADRKRGSSQVPEGSGEQRKMKETGCEVICGASTTLAVKG